ncbi:S8 family serine peptidase [Anaerobaca lacustris]|uniref:S8 family serine peptidase n=1 Tax=Anaerobaca lacustris TaxID=3044600 RepID=A0AAW6TQY6_9BACT|nr:S8 family serine peptidase [Sedimentisphaerales bacterium M17dextr]
MGTRHWVWVVAVVVGLSVCPGLVRAKAYRLTVAGEGMEFVAQPEMGYVVKVAERSGGFYSLAGLPALDTENARRIGGRDRRGVWTVENEGPAGRNEEMIRALRAGGHAAYAAPLFSCGGETVAVIPEIVIRVRPEVDTRQVHFLCKSLALAVIKPMEFTTQEYLLEVLGPDAEAVFAAVEQLNEMDVIEWACPNTAMRPKLAGQTMPNQIAWSGQPRSITAGEETERTGVFPNDEYFPMQWHLYNTGQSGGTPGADIRAPEAWEITTGNSNIVIAILDTGVDSSHPDLVDNLVPGYDFFEDDDMPDPAQLDRMDAHGTLCAGVAAAKGNNGIGVVGVAFDCRIMPVRIFDSQGSVTASKIAEAIRWAAVHGADVLSNSWGRSVGPIIHSAVTDVTQPGGIGRQGRGCVVCFVADNNGSLIPNNSSAALPEVSAVGAVDHKDVRWAYSSYGPQLSLVAPSGCDGEWCGGVSATLWTTDLTGPQGNSVFNDDPDLLDYTQYCGGTSVSCPIVAGVAALILSVNPHLTNEEVRDILCRSAKDLGEPGWDEYYGWGRVDARAAVEMALINSLSAIYVDDDGPNDPGPGDSTVSDPNENGSAEHPFDAIQKAIDYAFPGETIVLLDGHYSGPGNVNINLGGKPITVRSENGPQNCIIDCLGQGRGFDFHTSEGPETVLQGITITGGKGTNGAGIQIKGSSPTIRDCVLAGNSASMGGGGLAISGDSQPVIANCLLAGNLALLGGAVNAQTTADIKLTNCTLAHNTAVMAGGAVSVSGAISVELSNCILWDNGAAPIFGIATATYCNIQGSWPGEGNLDLDPLFADPTNGDYHLKSQAGRWDPASESWVQDDVTSPCIDAGDPAVSVGDEPEPNGGRINMGAYGGTPQASKSP